jgi:hypothetical protein
MAVGDKLEVVQYQGEVYQAVESDGSCAGCAESGFGGCGVFEAKCSCTDRADGKQAIWIKLEKEQPVVKSDTIKEIRAKTQVLQKEIYKLVEAFETDTGMVVHGVDLVHAQVIGETSTTYSIDLDVRLN